MASDARAEYLDEAGRFLAATQADGLSAATAAGALAEVMALRGSLCLHGDRAALDAPEIELVAVLAPRDLLPLLDPARVHDLRARLERFLDASQTCEGDVSLAETDDEADALLDEAEDLLWERHDLECQLAGVDWFTSRTPGLADQLQAARRGMGDALADLDAWWSAAIEHFLCINEARRAWRDELPDPERAWWWSLASECDLEAVYRAAEGGPTTPHVTHCGACGERLALLAGAVAALRAACGEVLLGHPNPEAIVRVFEGLASPEEVAAIDEHTRICPPCGREMQVLLDGERLDGENDAAADARAEIAVTYDVDPDVPIAVAADTEDDGLPRLPDECLMRDGDVSVWIDQVDDRIVLLILGSDPGALGPLAILDYDSGESTVAGTPIRQHDSVAYDLGAAADLAGRRLCLALTHGGLPLYIPRLDLRSQRATR